jgi:hypothetical protein
MKIVQAINSIISNSNKITKVISGAQQPDELFFLYEKDDKRYKWSIAKYDEELYSGQVATSSYLKYYGNKEKTIEEIATYAGPAREKEIGPIMTYSSDELKSREAKESMLELYRVVKEKQLGMDQVLDDIIVPF